MSTINVCNRCGKKIDRYRESDIAKDAKAIFRDGLSYIDVDFCDDCAKLLMQIIDDFLKRGGTE